MNNYDISDLVKLFETFGEIGNAERLVKAIINKRRVKRFETTFDMTELLTEEYDLNKKNQIGFLAKIFQALRIEVNNELENLNNVLRDSVDIIEKGGRIVIVSYHSLEDRIVKNFFKEESSRYRKSDNPYGDEEKNPRLKVLTKKPILPSFEEIKFNSRSRSAKLRAAEVI
ncbi:MAG: 16S rRNA (cytosine(1402)-N(4))-methyltransferase RsmH [Ignavibacteria bacterium]|nr:16S rRNA (cytosine(1402)-N(4))-methyltransferase RsmH [Ignavibacteria bacterium]